jgi:hypothetical protein
VELDQVLASGEATLAHGTGCGTATGRLHGAPATKRSFQASFFDYVRVDDGRIIEGSSKPTCPPRCDSSTARPRAWPGLDAMFLRP